MTAPTRRAALAGLSATPLVLSACGSREAPPATLRVALRGGWDSLDPMRAEYAVSALLIRQVFMPVVGYGPKGGPAPGLAASWSSDAAHRVWTFKVPAGRAWSDGRPITSTDLRDSLRHGADRDTAYPDASEFYMIEGYRDCVVGGADPSGIGVEAPDAETLVVRLNAPDAAFWSRMQEFYAVPLHAMSAHGAEWTRPERIVVSGPYKPAEQSQTRLVLKGNPAGGWQAPMVDTISVEAVEDASTRLRMFQSGDLDLVQDPPLLRARELAEAEGARFRRHPAPRILYMSMNTKRAALADAEVRRALAMSIDRAFITGTIMRGAVEPAGRFMRGEAEPPFDVEGARALLAARGISPARPLRFELLTVKDDRERAAIQMAQAWKPLGVEVTLFAADSNAVVARLNAFDFDAALVTLDKGMKFDPIDLMASWGEGGTAYSHQWKDEAFNAKLSEARAEADPARRKALAAAAESIINAAAPVTGIWYFPSNWLVSDRVKGGLEGIAPIIWPSLSLG